jgi:hypothetical protein
MVIVVPAQLSALQMYSGQMSGLPIISQILSKPYFVSFRVGPIHLPMESRMTILGQTSLGPKRAQARSLRVSIRWLYPMDEFR